MGSERGRKRVVEGVRRNQVTLAKRSWEKGSTAQVQGVSNDLTGRHALGNNN